MRLTVGSIGKACAVLALVAGSRPSQPLPWRALQVASMDLSVDEATNTANAALTLEDQAPGWLSIDGLRVHRVEGAVILYQDPTRLWLRPSRGAVRIDYELAPRSEDGWLPGGSTRTWPDYCGRIFPCDPDPEDGLVWDLTVTGAPPGSVTIAPDVRVESPAYMLAWATGPYTELPVGTSRGGVALTAAWLPGHKDAARVGSAELVSSFSALEDLLGPYPYGPTAGPVEVVWGDGAYGGMEHHPRWHLPGASLGDPAANIHEAAHGWFGDAIRIRCWEDLVLSEGTATYLEVRATAATRGPASEAPLWDAERESLAGARANGDHSPAWPTGCTTHPPTPLSEVPYSGGALFLRAVELRIGRETFDRALRSFVDQRRGTAAGMGDLITTLESASGVDLGPEVKALHDRGLSPRSPAPR